MGYVRGDKLQFAYAVLLEPVHTCPSGVSGEAAEKAFSTMNRSETICASFNTQRLTLGITSAVSIG